MDYVIRAHHNRPVRGTEGSRNERLREYLGKLTPAYDYALEVRGDHKRRQQREARLEVRYGEVRIQRPERIGGGKEQYPEQQDLDCTPFGRHG